MTTRLNCQRGEKRLVSQPLFMHAEPSPIQAGWTHASPTLFAIPAAAEPVELRFLVRIQALVEREQLRIFHFQSGEPSL